MNRFLAVPALNHYLCSKNQITMDKYLTFIIKAREKHGDKYDYSKVSYVNSSTKVTIICPKHGEFEQTPENHLSGQGCPKCANDLTADRCRMTTEEFINKAREIHGNKYDYSKVEYINSQSKVCIICPEHGEFWQTPHGHLKGCGCNKCGNLLIRTKLASNKKEFIKKARKIHGDKYNYDKVEYINSNEKVIIVCPIHGEFEQTPSHHLNGCGCPMCANNIKYSTHSFILSAIKVHGDKYNYDKVRYDGAFKKVIITCSKHGNFLQTPDNHLHGQGCPKCIQSNLEKEIETALKNNKVDFISYYKPLFLKTHKWHSQHLDFFIPFKNIAIECQGSTTL